MKGRLILAGGGSERDSLPLDEMLAFWLGSQGKMLYLPVAQRGMRSLDLCYEWICSTYLPLNITQIKMWTNLGEHQGSELDEFEAVYIGGGNTFSLLAQLRESGFDRYIQEYFDHDGIIYGGSAGAVVLGKDIRTVSHIDSNEVCLLETNGLNLLDGHSIWVHYQPHDDELIYDFINKDNQSVLAISERGGIVFQNDRMVSAGYEPSYRFENQDKYPV
jgi:dipeptidase E